MIRSLLFCLFGCLLLISCSDNTVQHEVNGCFKFELPKEFKQDSRFAGLNNAHRMNFIEGDRYGEQVIISCFKDRKFRDLNEAKSLSLSPLRKIHYPFKIQSEEQNDEMYLVQFDSFEGRGALLVSKHQDSYYSIEYRARKDKRDSEVLDLVSDIRKSLK